MQIFFLKCTKRRRNVKHKVCWGEKICVFLIPCTNKIGYIIVAEFFFLHSHTHLSANKELCSGFPHFALFLYWFYLATSTMVSEPAVYFKNGTFYHCKIKLYKILFLFLDSKILILFWDKCWSIKPKEPIRKLIYWLVVVRYVHMYGFDWLMTLISTSFRSTHFLILTWLGKFLGEMQGGVGRKGDIDEFGQKKLDC